MFFKQKKLINSIRAELNFLVPLPIEDKLTLKDIETINRIKKINGYLLILDLEINKEIKNEPVR